jgi:hypothetical protein
VYREGPAGVILQGYAANLVAICTSDTFGDGHSLRNLPRSTLP